MKIKLIINPNAGNGLGIIYLPIIKKKIDDSLNIYKTKCEGDATVEAKKSLDYDIVIAAGGDGTINEVINGLANSKVKLGIIPIGTTNVFAKELKLPIDIYNLCNIIKKSKTRIYDLGKANDKYFLLWCGIGFDASVLNEVDPIIKKILGFFSYPLTALKVMTNHKSQLIKVIVDGKEKEGYFLVVSNIKNYGILFEFSPHANPYDGKLDICLFQNKMDFLNVIKNMVKVKTRLHLNSKEVWHYQAKKIKVTSDSKILTHTDAEIIGTTPVDIKVVPKAISIIVP